MATPIGEGHWLEAVDLRAREANDINARVELIEYFRDAVASEPGSLRLWMAYCEYFWSLYSSPGDQQSREAFSLDAALSLWQKGYEAVQYRLADSHLLWDRWISLEMELLAQTRTEQGVRRVTQLFKNRLTVPHANWEMTSQNFSSFVSQYNPGAYESEMREMVEKAKDAKRIYGPRDDWEMRLVQAARSGNEGHVMTEYLQWEIQQAHTKKKDGVVHFQICLGLFARALTGVLASEEDAWINYAVLVSSTHSDIKAGRRTPETPTPNMLDTLKCAVRHVPWCGSLWARYILAAEESGLPFALVEEIKHAATNSPQIDRDGMEAVLDMYAAWCGYLKRTTMRPDATEESADVAEVGLPAALEDVKHWGRRRYGDAYQGDPNFRLEKILIQFYTEKKENVEAARAVWSRLAEIDLHANSYDFWLHWYLWEMVIFGSARAVARSPAPSAENARVPTFATHVFHKALKVRTLDWPERVMDVFLQHCNDYELPETLREANDTVYKTRKGVAKRRQREVAQAAEAAAGPPVVQDAAVGTTTTTTTTGDETSEPNTTAKRKRSEDHDPSKRAKSEAPAAAVKRDREHTSVFLTNLPEGVTDKKVRQFLNEYGAIRNVDLQTGGDGPPAALVEFKQADDARTALIRDGKKMDGVTVAVAPAVDCTLFVTNYPPAADDHFLRARFARFGTIHSIRFPSRRYNDKRRFCYITFRNPESAQAATALDGRPLGDARLPISVKISDPAARQSRQGAQAEGRELHVTHLPPDVGEKDVEAIFARVGAVESVRFPQAVAYGRPRTAFVCMEIKEEAERAIETLDRTVLGKHILTVEHSRRIPKPGPDDSASPVSAPATEDEPKPPRQPLVPPSVLRRPVLGGGGSKRGLGLAMSAKAAPSKSGKRAEGGAKSNADFKAMIEAGEGEGDGDKTTI